MNFAMQSNLLDEFNNTICYKLTEQSAKRLVEIIALMADDDEVAHELEARLHAAVLRDIEHPLAAIALSTRDITFSRWFA